MSAGLLTVQETAAELRMSRATVYRLFAAGELRWVQIGARRRVTAAEIDRFLAEHTEQRNWRPNRHLGLSPLSGGRAEGTHSTSAAVFERRCTWSRGNGPSVVRNAS